MTVKRKDTRTITEYILKNNDVFKGIECMPGEHTIKNDPNIKPVIHRHEKVKRELDRIERDCVVICINLRDLNRAILSENFSLKTIEDVIAEIATSGLWQTRLDADRSKLCTFTVTHH